jgi:hypothetical protein
MLRAFNKFTLGKTKFTPFKELTKQSIYNTVQRFVSANPQSKVNRENRELDKIEKYWEQVDIQIADKANILKEVENKYKTETIYVGRHISGKQTKIDPLIEEKLIEMYYIPLSKDDGNLLSNFSQATADAIVTGGRMVLYNEIVSYNRTQPIEKHLHLKPEFEPLNKEDIKELMQDFYEIYENEKIFNFILQNGKKMLNELRKIKYQKIKQCEDYRKKLNYVDHYGEVINNIPFNTKISKDFQKSEDPQYVAKFLKEKNIEDQNLTDTLKVIYFDYYNSVAESFTSGKNDKTKNYEGLNKIRPKLEPCLFDRTIAFLDYLKYNNMTFKVEKSQLPKEKEAYKIIEKLFIKGVKLNRYQNDEPNDYILIDSHEDEGIRYYLHKYLTGEKTKVFETQDINTTTAQFKSSEHHNSLSHYVKERNRNIILRVYLFLKHPIKVNVIQNNKNLCEYNDNYSFNHLAVFENELIAPHHTFLINNDFDSWLNKQMLGEWKLVDVDNFMKGNPFFLRKSSFVESFENVVKQDKYTYKNMESLFPDIKNPEVYIAPNLKEKSKKDKKGKDDKKEKSKDVKEEKSGLINSLQFDYKITKIERPFEDEETKEFKEVDKEYNKLIENEYKKKANLFEAQSKRHADIKRSIDEGLDNHQILEKLSKITQVDKKENIEIQKNFGEIKLPKFDEEGNQIPETFANEFERVLNEVVLKKIEHLLPAKKDAKSK